MEYIALIHKEANSDYGVSFPDIPGCVTAGTTLDEARALAAEALTFHLEGLLEDEEPLPVPTELSEIMAERENRDAVAFLVPVEIEARSVRVNITLPESDLRRIDRYAERHGLTRSGFLVHAARRAISADRHEGAGS